MTTRQLLLIETTRFGVPLGGRWYRTEEGVITEHARKPGYLLAWDIHNKGKIFGIYQDLSLEEFATTLERVPAERRHGYQIMLYTEECPGYMILQWKGAPDPEHATLREALRRLRPRCGHEYARRMLRDSQPPDIVCYCNTCEIPKKRDRMHSYYVIVKNMIFDNNHDGYMRAFFSLDMREIDLDAYTRNRQLLLPNCRSYGSGVALTKLVLPPS